MEVSPPPQSSLPHAASPVGRQAALRSSTSPFAALWLALLRVRSGWRILLAIAANVLLAVTLLCAVPLYTNLFAAIELHAQLAQQPAGGTNVDVTITQTHLSTALQLREEQTVTSLARTTLSLFAPTAPSNFLVAGPLRMTSRNGFAPKANTQVQFAAYGGGQFLSHIRLLAGSLLPTSPAAQASDGVPLALVTQQMTEVDGIQVGDRLSISGPSFFEEQALIVQVAGVWVPRNPADPYWNGRSFVSSPQHDSEPFVFPVLLAPTMLAPTLSQLDSAIVTQHWTFFTQTSAITLAQMPAIADALTQFRTHLAVAMANTSFVVSILTITGLDKVLAAVTTQQQRYALAFDAVGALVLGIALVVLAVVVHVFVARDRAMLATARFRGASILQLAGSYIMVTTIAGALATLPGVMLALWLAPEIIVHFVSPAALPDTPAASAYIARELHPGQIVAPALFCLLFAIAICCWTAASTLRGDIHALAATTLASGTGAARPFWQRLYLDVFLAVLCAAGYLDLTYYGAAQLAPSPLLVSVPLLMLLAVALLLLRLFPLVTIFWTRIAIRSRGAMALLSSSQLARGRTSAALQALVVMLAIGLATLAAMYDANAQQGAASLAAHQAGADIRLVEQTTQTSAADVLVRAQLARLPGMSGVTPVYRGSVYTQVYWNVAGAALDAVDTLAIDPRSWATISGDTWQSSYASVSLASLMATMRAHEPTSPRDVAQAGTADAPLWVIVSHSFAQTQGRKPGDIFSMVLPNSYTHFSSFIVGAIVNDFPTLDPAHRPGGFIVADQRSFFAAMAAHSEANDAAIGPNEYWLHTSGNKDTLAALQRQQAELGVATIISRDALAAAIFSMPSLVGMRTLLLASVATIGLLTLLALGLQTALDTRQRRRQLLAMRAIGVSRPQVVGLLLLERAITMLFGVCGGLLAGVVVIALTLPYLTAAEPASAASREALVRALLTYPQPCALTIGPLVGLLLLAHVIISLRAARAPINLWLLNSAD